MMVASHREIHLHQINFSEQTVLTVLVNTDPSCSFAIACIFAIKIRSRLHNMSVHVNMIDYPPVGLSSSATSHILWISLCVTQHLGNVFST